MRRWLTLSLLLAVAALALTWYVWRFRLAGLPERLPSHWNYQGQVDGWIARKDFLPTFLVIPSAMVGLVGLTAVLPLVSPRRFTVDTFRTTYFFCMLLLQALLLFLHVITLLAVLGEVVDVGRWLVGGLMPFLMLLGNVLGKVRRNFWVGIRTPWTLADQGVWERTHRLGAWLFVAAGVLGLVEVLAGLPLFLPLAGVVLAGFIPALYSLWIYKRLERQGRLGESDVAVDRTARAVPTNLESENP